MTPITYGIISIIAMLVLAGLIFSGKVSPMVSMITVAVALCILLLVTGNTMDDITTWVSGGLKKQADNITMFTFAIIFFSMMQDTGVFDRIVGVLVKLIGNNVYLAALMTVIVAIIGHADGQGVTTYLIAVPPMLMVYKRLNMRPVMLLTLVSITIGIENVVPWAGPCGRYAAGLGLDATELWLYGLPAQIFGLLYVMVLALLFARIEVKRGAGAVSVLGGNLNEVEQGEEKIPEAGAEKAELRRPKLMWVNTAIMIVLMVAIFTKAAPITVCFMVACALGFIINYPSLKLQKKLIESYGGPVATSVSVLLASSFVAGVMSNSPLGSGMTELTAALVPAEASKHIMAVFCFILGPMNFVGFSSSVMSVTLAPALAEMVSIHGITATQVASIFNVCWQPMNMFAPDTPAMWIGLGLGGVEYKDHLRYGLKWGYLGCVLTSIFMLLIGRYPL